jgi:hypothetical protein
MSERTSQNGDGSRSGGIETSLAGMAGSFIQRAGASVRGFASEFFGSGWFPPGEPTPAVAPAGTRPRTQDYPSLANTGSWQPKVGEGVSYSQLRALADGYDLLRVVIETRKDQFSKMPYSFRVKREDGEKNAEFKQRNASDERITQLTEFFKRPDGEHDFNTWAKSLLEDLFVCDAPTLLPRYTFDGKLFCFDVVDGTTIRRVINVDGKTPLPPAVAYQQVIKGMPAVDLSAPNPDDIAMPQLVYRPRNVRAHRIYGFSPVEQIIMTVNIALRRQMHQLNYYTEGNVPDVLIGVPQNWNPEQIEKFTRFWNQFFIAEGQGARRKAKFVPGGMDVTFTQEPTLKDEFDEWLARLVAFAFSIPPNALVKQVNRASGEQMHDAALEEGLEPVLLWFASFMNFLIETYFGFDDIEFAFSDEQNVDPKVQAEIDDLYLKNGTTNINEVRDALGKDPLEGEDTPNMIYTMSGATPIADAIESSAVALEQKKNPPEPTAPIGGAPRVPNGKQVKKKSIRVSAGTVTPAMRKRTAPLAGAITKFFEKQKKRIAKAICREYAKVVADDKQKTFRADVIAKSDASDVLKQLDLDDWTALKKIVRDDLITIFKDSGKNALTELAVDDFAAIFDMVSEDAVAFAEERGAELVTMVTEATRNKIRTLVVDALSDGMTVDELSSAIVDSVAFSEERALTIARTELAFASVNGAIDAWDESGVVVKKQVILGSEHDNDDECDDAADDGAIGLTETFSNGLFAPPFHPNCVCDVIAITDVAEESPRGGATA